jgi:hypothetical protein
MQGSTVTNRADSIRVVHPLFQAEGGGAIPTSALQLRIDGTDFRTAKALNRKWHSRLPRIGDPESIMRASLCYGAEFDGLWYAIAIWSHPVNRSLPQTEWLELRRLAIAPDAPKNTASRMIAVMTRLIRKARPEVSRLISYQDMEVHTGGIYKAAGWTSDYVAHSASWTNNVRTRPAEQSASPKRRWEKVLYERPTEAGTDCPEPAGTEANVPLPERAENRTGKRHALTGSFFGDSPTDDG